MDVAFNTDHAPPRLDSFASSHRYPLIDAQQKLMRSLARLAIIWSLSFLVAGCGGSAYPRIGENGEIHSTGDAGEVLTAVDRAADDEMNSAIGANDTMGLQQMVAAGKVLQVKNGTKVLVIDLTSDETRVRILEGEYAGQAVWVL
jgi:hypothetical protein